MFGTWEWIYLACLLFGLGYLVMLVLGGQFGGDVDSDLSLEADLDADFDLSVDADTDFDSGQDAGTSHDFSFFTPLVLASLFAGIGGVGLFSSLTLGLPWFLHLPAASLGGWAVGYLSYILYARVIAPMQGSSEVRVADLWGTVAEVTTPIPPHRLGEIRFIASGSYVTTPARSATGEALARGQLVLIERIDNSVATVRPTR